MKNTNLKLVQSRDEIKKDPAKVGQAVYDILSKPQSSQEVGETADAMAPKYFKELLAAVDGNKDKFESPFYVVVLRKKEPWAMNVLRQWFVSRGTRPDPKVLRQDYPNHDHDVWKVDSKSYDVALQWTLPTRQDSASILKSADQYDPSLVKWIKQFNNGSLV